MDSFFKIDDPQSVLNGLTKNGMLTAICTKESAGESNNLYHRGDTVSISH